MIDHSKAPWVDPTLGWKPLPVPELPERVLIDFATKCNLRCPMCPVWGSEDDNAIDSVKGIMDARCVASALLDEMCAGTSADPAQHVRRAAACSRTCASACADMKSRGIAIAFNTNGLTLDEDLATFMVEIEVDFDLVQHRRRDSRNAEEDPRHRQDREDRSGGVPHAGGARRRAGCRASASPSRCRTRIVTRRRPSSNAGAGSSTACASVCCSRTALSRT